MLSTTTKTKSNLVRALLTSSVLIASVSYMNVAGAATVATNGADVPPPVLSSGDDYNFNTDNKLTVADGINIGETVGVSAVNNAGAINRGSIKFDGSSTVAGTIGIRGNGGLKLLDFQGPAGAVVTLEGNAVALDADLANNGALISNGTFTLTSDLNAANNGSAIFNKAFSTNDATFNNEFQSTFNAQADFTNDLILNNNAIVSLQTGTVTNDLKINDTARVIFNDDYTITTDLIFEAGGTAQVASNKTVTITNNLTTVAGSQLTFDLGLTATPGKFAATKNANITGNEVVNIINPGLASFAQGVNGPITIVQSVTGATIAAAPTLNTPNNLFLTYDLSTPVGNKLLQLTVTRTTPTGLNDNIQGVASVLGTVTTANTSGALLALTNQLGTLTTAQQKQALESVAPLVDSAISNAVLTIQDNTFDLFSQRINELQAGVRHYNSGYAAGHMDERGHGTWVKLFGNHADQNERSDTEGYKAETWGVAAGADMMLTENLLIGAALSWASVDINHDLNSGDTDVNSYQASLYGSWNINGPMFLNWMASAAYSDYQSTRHTIVGAFNQTTIADFDGAQYGARAELGYVMGKEAFHITPTASLTYSHVDFDDYREKGNSTANQTVNYSDIDALWAGIGVKLSYDMDCRQSLISPEVHANIAYDVIGDEATSNSQFVNFGPSFETVGASPARTDYNLGLSLSTQGKSGLGMSISYDHNWRTDYHANSGFVRVRYEW